VFSREGERAERMYLVIEGDVDVTRRRLLQRGYDNLKTIRSGELFGLVSLIDSNTHSATCTANGAVTVAYLPRSAFDLLFKTHARIGRHFQLLVAQQLVHDMRAYTALLINKLLAREDRPTE
jgi:CRP-like cAMP-binding protein